MLWAPCGLVALIACAAGSLCHPQSVAHARTGTGSDVMGLCGLLALIACAAGRQRQC